MIFRGGPSTIGGIPFGIGIIFGGGIVVNICSTLVRIGGVVKSCSTIFLGIISPIVVPSNTG